MKKVVIALMSLALVATNSSCKKDTDLTTDIVGRYNSEDGYTDYFVVNKIDNETVSIVTATGLNGQFLATKMNSKTSCTLSESRTEVSDGYYLSSGTGTLSGQNLTLHVETKMYDSNGNQRPGVMTQAFLGIKYK